MGCRNAAKIDLEASDGTHGSPKGFLRTQVCHFGRFGGHFGVICEVKIEPKSMPEISVFSSMNFVRFWGVSGCLFASFFDHFRGLQG